MGPSDWQASSLVLPMKFSSVWRAANLYRHLSLFTSLANFREKHLCWNLLLIKLQTLGLGFYRAPPGDCFSFDMLQCWAFFFFKFYFNGQFYLFKKSVILTNLIFTKINFDIFYWNLFFITWLWNFAIFYFIIY